MEKVSLCLEQSKLVFITIKQVFLLFFVFFSLSWPHPQSLQTAYLLSDCKNIVVAWDPGDLQAFSSD